MSGSVLLTDFFPAQVLRPTDLTADVAVPAVQSATFDWDKFIGARIATGSENLYAEALELMERELVVRVLRHTDGNQLQAARILGITRGSLRNKIRALGISIAKSIWSDEDPGDS
jgi:two-component system, NtrC family, response regulator AtoC